MKEMKVYRFEQWIDAPIDLVYDYIHKDDHVRQWNSIVMGNEYECKEEDIAVGTTFKTTMKIDKKVLTFDAEIVEHEPPYKGTVQTRSKEGVSMTRYRLSEEEGGTKLVVEASLTPSNLYYKMATKLFGWTVKFVYNEQYEQFVDYVYTGFKRLEYFNTECEEYIEAACKYNDQKHIYEVYFGDIEDEQMHNTFMRLGYDISENGEALLFTTQDPDETQQLFEQWAEEVFFQHVYERVKQGEN
ncbi:SRPBCC family protein [Pontibacillus litoralis]|uniref:Activator of Hsp90 ATPase homologue 1/2-like C-terminal domain-containing protein n=1 Tax=Pontibacillus litoralis JSM 072002 TaxID=1385512 RepID=A0A0A5G4R8_9BACI|nr:SRPBCC family protein [Pontibacillus litoralis]KGX87019.1 hypothetical protein N784_02550 [Pontibacillus litoralis JSM 072002]